MHTSGPHAQKGDIPQRTTLAKDACVQYHLEDTVPPTLLFRPLLSILSLFGNHAAPTYVPSPPLLLIETPARHDWRFHLPADVDTTRSSALHGDVPAHMLGQATHSIGPWRAGTLNPGLALPAPASSATAAAPPPQPPPPALPAGLTPQAVAGWQQVAICETGGNWKVVGPVFSGGLGFRNINWVAYGGSEFAPYAGEASPIDQMIVASRIQSSPPRTPGEGCSGYHGW